MISTSTDQLITRGKVGLDIVRLNQGEPIIQADPNGWDNRFTLNPTAILLNRSEVNDRLISGLLDGLSLDNPLLEDGVVVVFYRGIPKDDACPGRCRSAVGCAVLTPDLQLLKRFSHPVLSPADDPTGCDYDGVEDQRITRIGDTFYFVYCGFKAGTNKIQVCMAESRDLINWLKLGPVKGDVNNYPNKDAVILPKAIDGNYIMLHRPSNGRQSDFSVALAVSDSPTGVWKDCGTVMSAVRHPKYAESWVGMGSTPLEIDDDIFLADYHTGNYLPSGAREYFASFAILNFRDFDIKKPKSIVESRCEAVLFPQTPHEVNSPWPHSRRLDCVFPCGSYEYRGDIYMIYGGADAYVLAAKVNKQDLLRCNKEICRSNSRMVWASAL